MKVGLLQFDLLIPGARSLKDKRRVVKSLKERLRSRFNCSVIEAGSQDKWARAQFVACVVATDGAHVSAQLNEIIRFVNGEKAAELVNYTIEEL